MTVDGLRIALDARWAQGGGIVGGVGRSLHELIPHLARSAQVTSLVLLTDARRAQLGYECAGEVPLPTPFPGTAAAWLQWSAPRWLARHRDLTFHCEWYGLPYRQPTAMTATVHDLTFEHRPEWFTPTRRAAFRAQARHAARTAACLLTPSQYVKEDVVRTYGVDPDRILVAPRAASPMFSPAAADHPFRSELPDRYLVALAGARRRRVDIALQAARESECGLPLLVVGAEGPPEDRVRRLGRLSDPQWAACLAGAEALLYPTEDEGFGMPALEAIASGTPVICGPVASLPEVLGAAAVWVEDHSAAGFARAVDRLVADADLHGALCERGLRRAAEAPGWPEIAEIYLRAFRASAKARP